MPRKNNFKHQTYSADQPNAAYEFIKPEYLPSNHPDFLPRLGTVANKLRSAGVSRIYLVHGTFTGNDALGFIREISEVAPSVVDRLLAKRKSLADAIAGETGNFSESYRQRLFDALNRESQDKDARIDVRLFDWSSENHHLGRIEGAVRLTHELRTLETKKRALMLGHSHAGNVFALTTNLWGADSHSLNQLFEILKPFYSSGHQASDTSHWPSIRTTLSDKAMASRFDFATMGTPIRYGWDNDGFGHLVHLVHHRAAPDVPSYRAKFPLSIDEITHATFGDYVQLLGIAGTNFLPYLLRRRNLMIERQLKKLLQPTLRRRDTLQRLRLGNRVHHEGVTLLADFPDDEQHLRQAALGHGVYTRHEYMVCQLEQIVGRFYGGKSGREKEE